MGLAILRRTDSFGLLLITCRLVARWDDLDEVSKVLTLQLMLRMPRHQAGQKVVVPRVPGRLTGEDVS